MPLRVFHNGCRTVESHRLIIQESCGKRCEVVVFQISTGISDQREAGGVGFRKSVKCERSDREHDLILGFTRDAIAFHAGAEFGFDLLHPLFRTFESHSAAQFFGFTASESCDHHGHSQKLLLEKWDTQSELEHRFERGMSVSYFLTSLPPL